jgi:omega-amidase
MILNVSIWQSNPVWQSPEENHHLLEKTIKACNGATDLLICPEMYLTGYDVSGNTAFTMDAKELKKIKAFSKAHQITIAGSYAISEHRNKYNRFLLIQDGEIIHQYDKIHLFDMAGEGDTFTAGSPHQKNIIEFKEWKLRPLICYDLRFPYLSYKEPFADVIIYVASWPQKRIAHWQHLLRARAIENQAYVIGVNRIGRDANGYEYNGCSVVIDHKGELMADFMENTEEVVSVALDLESLRQYRKRFPFLADSIITNQKG